MYAVAVQSDGKIIIGGAFSSYGGVIMQSIVRLNSNGNQDTSFVVGTGFTGAGAGLFSIVIQPDGKILVGGIFTSYNGTTQNYISRLNSDGTLDVGFTIGTGFNNSVLTIAVQSDGKILVGGSFTSYNGTAQNYISRLNTDGTLDTDFATAIGTGFSASVNTIAVQPNNQKILVGGTFTSYNGTTQNRITRLNSDATLDSEFTIGTGFNNTVFAIAIQLDAKIIVGGTFLSYNGTSQYGIFRLNASGNRDISFTTGGTFYTTMYAIALY